MASGLTNKGKFRMLEQSLSNGAEPTVLYLALVTSATAPTAATNTLSQLTEIAAGNGYTAGGISLTRNGTNFAATEDDGNNWGQVAVPSQVWTASGGNLPASGNGARWAVLTDDNVTQGSREVYGWFDLSADRTVSVGQALTLQNILIRLT